MPPEAPQHVLVVHRLILLGVVVAARMIGMQVRHPLCAVLAVPQQALGVAQVPEANPQVIEEQPRHIPAQIQVPADDVGDVRNLVERAAHRVARQRREAGRVCLMNHVVEKAVVVQHVLLFLRRDGDFVRHAPADDGRMIVVLLNQLFHLADGVRAAVGHVLADVGDFRPDNQAVAVAEVVEILVVLVVRQPQRRRADFADERHVLVVHLARDRVADALAILVAAHAMQVIRFVVEDEAVLFVHAEGANAEGNFQPIGDAAVHRDFTARSIKVGIFHAMPAARLRHLDGRVQPRARADDAPLAVNNRHGHVARRHPALYAHLRARAFGRRRHADAGRTEVIQREMRLVHHQQTNHAVDAAVEREVRHLRIHAVVLAVVHFDSQLVLVRQQPGQVRAERGVAAVVAAHVLPVQADLRRGIHAVKFNPHFLRVRVEFRLLKRQRVSACAALVVVAAVLPVDGVPCVRNGDFARLPVQIRELPAVLEFNDVSHVGTSLGESKKTQKAPPMRVERRITQPSLCECTQRFRR